MLPVVDASGPQRRPTRRTVLLLAGAGVAVATATVVRARASEAPAERAAVSPPRVLRSDVPHLRTWMAWPASAAVWGALLPGVQADIARVARTIARYEPVVMCASADAAAGARRWCGPSVQVIDAVPVDDCWMRDSGPVFRVDGAGRHDAVGLNFDGWGGAQRAGRDRRVAAGVARWAGLAFSTADLEGEGGAIETDGDGTVMATESSLVDPDRNPGATKEQVEAAVLAAYGADTMIWLPGISDRDITDDHVDATSRFVRPGVVLVQVPPDDRTDIWAVDARRQREILSRSVDAHGRRLRVIPVGGPTVLPSTAPGFLDSYVNFHTVNGAVVTAKFGDDEADAACADVLAAAFPDRVVEQIRVDHLHAGGGGIHCVTTEQPNPGASEDEARAVDG